MIFKLTVAVSGTDSHSSPYDLKAIGKQTWDRWKCTNTYIAVTLCRRKGANQPPEENQPAGNVLVKKKRTMLAM